VTSQVDRLKQQLAEKDRNITQLQTSISTLESRVGRETVSFERAPVQERVPVQQSGGAPTRDNLDVLYDALRRITEEALNDNNRASLEDLGGDQDLSGSRRRDTSRSTSVKSFIYFVFHYNSKNSFKYE